MNAMHVVKLRYLLIYVTAFRGKIPLQNFVAPTLKARGSLIDCNRHAFFGRIRNQICDLRSYIYSSLAMTTQDRRQ